MTVWDTSVLKHKLEFEKVSTTKIPRHSEPVRNDMDD